jgi:hypothetical protein
MRFSKNNVFIGLGIFLVLVLAMAVIYFIGNKDQEISSNIKPQILALSEAKDYLLSISNRPALDKALQDYGFWDYQWDNQSKVSVLQVIYTDNVQPQSVLMDIGPDGKTKTIIASYSYSVKSNVLTMRVYVNQNAGLDKQTKDWYVEEYLLRLIYDHGLNRSRGEEKFYSRFYSEQPYFFEIKSL